uniref:Uncharacterized protein n=1 Tax=Rhizophora mucronata TaxID=61149 RepID=A0A2P2QZI3_RHIMU
MQTPARTRNVSLKQFGPMQEMPELYRIFNSCCFAASLSYTKPANRPEKRNAPRGFPSDTKLYRIPKCFKPKSSETVGIIMEN